MAPPSKKNNPIRVRTKAAMKQYEPVKESSSSKAVATVENEVEPAQPHPGFSPSIKKQIDDFAKSIDLAPVVPDVIGIAKLVFEKKGIPFVTPKAHDANRTDNWLDQFVHASVYKIDREIEQLQNGTHPGIAKIISEHNDHVEGLKNTFGREMVDFYEREEKIEQKLIEESEKEAQTTISNFVQAELDRTEEAETAALNILNKMKRFNVGRSSNLPPKRNKPIRKRAVAQLGPPVVLEKRGTKKEKIEVFAPFAHLPEKEILDDMKIIDKVRQERTGEKPMPPKYLFKAVVEPGKVIRDGKIYYKSQVVFVETENMGKFPGVIVSITDKYATIRSTIIGDNRLIEVTANDLQVGRVQFKKKPATAKVSKEENK
uniref:PBECR3 domain-containing protein n=1 Tax=Rhabditophanes sp. KR3021 TaxID=114890 RepID=A0AC35U6C3_9BILA